MDPQTVADRLDQVQLVDVRYDNEWEAGHIEGAVHIPEDDLEDRLDELDRSRPVVTVCRAGTRSDEAAEWLRSQGFDAQSLDGGMLAWKWAGLPMTGGIVEPDPKPELSSDEMQQLHNDFLSLALDIQAHFGVGVQPSEEELRGFLRQRLINEGRTPEEADAFLAQAESAHARVPAPSWLARSRLERARVLLTRRATGDVERAGDLLGEVVGTARKYGLAAVERSATELLHETGLST